MDPLEPLPFWLLALIVCVTAFIAGLLFGAEVL
jgi:hypothetical protein